jgi:SDR family mycofactocin-dependent oxidoreductase
MTGLLQDKVVFITGLARGMGRSHAIRLAQEGANVIGIDICEQIDTVDYPMSTEDDLRTTIKEVESLDRRIIAHKGDVRDIESMRSVLDEGMSEFGRLDFVLANAGILPHHGAPSKTMKAWHDTLDVMLTGVLNTIEVTYPVIVEQGEGGSIVVTSSMAAFKPMFRTESGKNFGTLGYSAAKAALVNLAMNYASLLARHHVRVNTVHPTGVHTPMIQGTMHDDYIASLDSEDLQVLINAIPVDAVDPVDISNVMLWLCSDASRYFTGNAVRLDAGASLR